MNGYHRPFTLTDPSLSYPYKPDIVSLALVAALSIIVPAAAIVIVNGCALAFHWGWRKQSTFADELRSVLWQTHAGWLGLALSLASTLFVTAGLKDMVGKPRPDLYGRCDPDLVNITKYVVGGFASNLIDEATPLVTSDICRQSDAKILNDGFASFPSGHSSFSSSGMVYLTLWLCGRWSITPAQVWYGISGKNNARSSRSASVPPLWLYAIALSPLVLMAFICTSRYADFHHAGIDIFVGALIGSIFSWFTFRLYHVPVGYGEGLRAWGPRADDRAFLGGGRVSRSVDEEAGLVMTDYPTASTQPVDGTAGQHQA